MQGTKLHIAFFSQALQSFKRFDNDQLPCQLRQVMGCGACVTAIKNHISFADSLKPARIRPVLKDAGYDA
jgi:hypothetical protein